MKTTLTAYLNLSLVSALSLAAVVNLVACGKKVSKDAEKQAEAICAETDPACAKKTTDVVGSKVEKTGGSTVSFKDIEVKHGMPGYVEVKDVKTDAAGNVYLALNRDVHQEAASASSATNLNASKANFFRIIKLDKTGKEVWRFPSAIVLDPAIRALTSNTATSEFDGHFVTALDVNEKGQVAFATHTNWDVAGYHSKVVILNEEKDGSVLQKTFSQASDSAFDVANIHSEYVRNISLNKEGTEFVLDYRVANTNFEAASVSPHSFAVGFAQLQRYSTQGKLQGISCYYGASQGKLGAEFNLFLAPQDQALAGVAVPFGCLAPQAGSATLPTASFQGPIRFVPAELKPAQLANYIPTAFPNAWGILKGEKLPFQETGKQASFLEVSANILKSNILGVNIDSERTLLTGLSSISQTGDLETQVLTGKAAEEGKDPGAFLGLTLAGTGERDAKLVGIFSSGRKVKNALLLKRKSGEAALNAEQDGSNKYLAIYSGELGSKTVEVSNPVKISGVSGSRFESVSGAAVTQLAGFSLLTAYSLADKEFVGTDGFTEEVRTKVMLKVVE